MQQTKGISKKQKLAAEILANPDFKGTITDMCNEIGVARSTFYRWLSEPTFRKYIDEMIDRFTDSELSNVWKSLIRRATTGNVEAQKLYFELKDKYKQQIEVSGGVVILDDLANKD